MNPLPPQAYTKEVLLKAYSWLQNQNPSIKEMASTPDVLVSLFLKATRDGDEVLERPSIQNFKKELKSIAEMMGEFDKDVAKDNGSNQNLQTHPDMQNSNAATRSKPAVMPPANMKAQLSQDAVTSYTHNISSNTMAGTSSLQNSAANASQFAPATGQQIAPAGQQVASSDGSQFASSNGQQVGPGGLQASSTGRQVGLDGSQIASMQGLQIAPSLQTLDTRSQYMIQEVKELLNLSSESEALRLLIKLGHQKAKTLSN